MAATRPDRSAAGITPAVVGKLVDALQDGVALTDGGGTLVLANLRLEEMYDVGLSLQAAADLPHDAASKGIAEAVRHLDDTIRHIRDNAFTTRDQETDPAPRNDAG